MPLTVITVKNAPPSLKGDLSKWMQEIATGVYVGNFNSRIREKLWIRVKEHIGRGEATLSYYCRNELGYRFDTFNAERFVVERDGIPLVFFPKPESAQRSGYDRGFSQAAKNRRCRKYASSTKKDAFVIVDIETEGLNEEENAIIEVGAIKIEGIKTTTFQSLICLDRKLPTKIVALTGITNEMLERNGEPLIKVLDRFCEFVGNLPLVGYGLDFDLRFINYNLRLLDRTPLTNKTVDLLQVVKKEKRLSSYALQTVIETYGIEKRVPHRALLDAEIIYELSQKLMKFSEG